MKDLIITSLKAQQEYVSARIKPKAGQQYYNEMMDYIIILISRFENYQMCLIILEQVFANLKPQIFSLNYELKYKKLAIRQASETVITITDRFNGKKYV